MQWTLVPIFKPSAKYNVKLRQKIGSFCCSCLVKHILMFIIKNNTAICGQLDLLPKDRHMIAVRNTPMSQFLAAAQDGNLNSLPACISSIPFDDIHYALWVAAEMGHTQCVDFLVPECNACAVDSRALLLAATNGHADCVKILIEVSDPLANNCAALMKAVEGRHVECVKLLLPVSNPNANQGRALELAVYNHDEECVRLLAQVADDTNFNYVLGVAAAYGDTISVNILLEYHLDHHIDEKAVNSALAVAVGHGHHDTVHALLPWCNVKDNCSFALQTALRQKQYTIAELLYPLSDPHDALWAMEQLNNPQDQHCVQWLEEYISGALRTTMLEHFNSHGGNGESEQRKM